jgi:hypothetical protein
MTYIRKDAQNALVGSRLDYFLVRGQIQGWTEEVSIKELGIAKVDHKAVSLTLNFAQVKQEKKRYFMNTSILNNKVFIRNMCDMITQYQHNYPPPRDEDKYGTWWDTFKTKMMAYSQLTSRFLATEKKCERQSILLKLERNEKALHKHPSSTTLMDEREGLKAALIAHQKDEYEGEYIRSKAKIYIEHEKSSSSFFNLEKTRGEKKLIRELVTDTGVSLTNADEIANEVRTFWGKLFHSPDIEGEYPVTQEDKQKSTVLI